MPRHSFVRTVKLSDVNGRIDYISSPKRQEHCYAFYNTAATEFWQRLSDQAQFDFWKSHQKNGKCIEARELIIALPESLQQQDPKLLLQVFTEIFRQKYGVQCAAALHHNNAMTNYHIHLIFADRDPLEKPIVKKASRNMFFDETGRHVRTKKEILDDHGNVRPGCRILAKGETYDIKWFSFRNDYFKSRAFMQEAKVMYTGLINHFVSEEEKLQLFDPSGPYLPTKKIGKNNPLAAEISSDNELRQEWNQTVDQVLIAGGSQEEVTDFKKSEVTEKVAESIRENGNAPGLFSQVLQFAIAILKEFLDLLMQGSEPDLSESEMGEEVQQANAPETAEISDAEFRKAESEFMRMDGIHQKLNKANRKVYALQKQKKSLQETLNTIPNNLFHRKERGAIEDRIEGLQRQIDLAHAQLEAIPKQHGFGDVKCAEAAYRVAKANLESLKDKTGGTGKEAVAKSARAKTQKQKVSVLKELAAKRLEAQQEEAKRRNKERGRKEVRRTEI